MEAEKSIKRKLKEAQSMLVNADRAKQRSKIVFVAPKLDSRGGKRS
jgi:hypothetical protein